MGRLRRLRRSCPNQHPVHTSVAHSAHAWRAWGHSDVPALQSHSDTGRPCSVGSKSSRPCRRTSPAPAGDNGSEQLRRPAAARQRLPHQFFGWAVALLFRFGSTSRCWPLLLIQLFPPGTKDSTENLSPSRYAKGQLTYVSASMSSLPSSSLTKAAQNGKDSNCEHHAAN